MSSNMNFNPDEFNDLLEITEVRGIVAKCKPAKEDNVFTDTTMSDYINEIIGLNIYKRSEVIEENKESDNSIWVADVYFKVDNSMQIFYLKFPGDMSQDEVVHYMRPIINHIEKHKKSIN